MRFFYDCEFIDDGKTIDLISIGIVAEDGRELYMQSVEFDPAKASYWVKKNVLASLVVCEHLSGNERGLYAHAGGQCSFTDLDRGVVGMHADCPWRTRKQIKRELLYFMDIEKYGKPELWGYYSAYDHVAFCQLFGKMIDLPKSFPMYTRDLKQWCDALGNPRLPEQGKDEHNALADARWNKFAYDFLVGYSLPVRIRERMRK